MPACVTDLVTSACIIWKQTTESSRDDTVMQPLSSSHIRLLDKVTHRDSRIKEFIGD